MLAIRFHRVREFPVRYAIVDPAHEDAVRNYLSLMSVAHRAPQLHRQARGVLQPVYHKGYLEGDRVGEGDQTSPLMPHLFDRVMMGDHMALSQYLDQLGDYGHTLPPGVTAAGKRLPHSELIDLLTRLHDHITRGVKPSTGAHDWGGRIPTAMSRAAILHPESADSAGRAYNWLLPALHNVAGDPNSRRLLPQTADALSNRIRQLGDTGDVRIVPGIHAALGTLGEHPQIPERVEHESAHLQNMLGDRLRNNTIPLLFGTFG